MKISEMKVNYDETECEITPQQARDALRIIEALGLISEYEEQIFASIEEEDILLKINEKEFGDVLKAFLKNHKTLSIKYEKPEEYTYGIYEDIEGIRITYMDKAETIRIIGEANTIRYFMKE